MVSNVVIQDILAKKAAGVERMRYRQMRIQERLADRVENDPKAIEEGLSKVRSQLAKRACPAREIYQEWETILTTKTASYVANLLRDTSPESDQLRACAPFKLA
ncbi:hypothetical protein ACFPK9_10830 [Rubritalea spongiae]|uniref:Uncharacterized protein n=1 Tax=Rubritalea spongiae TaxID=430797 RepID=A0ABW5E199_9BACT